MSRTRTDGRVRAGFTIVELLVAITISAMLMVGMVSFFIGTLRLIGDAVIESETSLAMRDFREKLLYRVVTPYDNCVWSGVASGSGLSVGDSSVICSTFGVRPANGESVAQPVNLTIRNQSGYFVNTVALNHDSQVTPWFCSYKLPLLNDVYRVDTRRFADYHLFSVYLRHTTDHRDFRQRIVVPEFGREQQPGATRVFHD